MGKFMKNQNVEFFPDGLKIDDWFYDTYVRA